MKSLIASALILMAGLAQAQEVSRGTGAVLRSLDKIAASTTDLSLPNGGSAELGKLRIQLAECRYPAGNRAGDAFAYIIVTEEGREETVFSGWIVASSPALNAVDHSRYDVWVLRCRTD